MSSFDYTQITNAQMLDWAKALKRTTTKPLDASSMFNSLTDAEAYIKGDGSDARGLGKTSYVGQIITVYENNKVTTYQIGLKTELVDGVETEVRVLESIGSGVIVLENFTIQNGNIVEATADKVGSLVYITTGTDTYPKGLYVITGANKIVTFATPDNLKIVKKLTANSGASATYELQLNGIKQGVAIDIPKDLVVSSGSIVTFTDANKPFPEGVTTAGTYIKLTLANSGGDLYINVNSLIDVYTSGDDYININGYTISLNFDTLVTAILSSDAFTDIIQGLQSQFNSILQNYATIAQMQIDIEFPEVMVAQTNNTCKVYCPDALRGAVINFGNYGNVTIGPDKGIIISNLPAGTVNLTATITTENLSWTKYYTVTVVEAPILVVGANSTEFPHVFMKKSVLGQVYMESTTGIDLELESNVFYIGFKQTVDKLEVYNNGQFIPMTHIKDTTSLPAEIQEYTTVFQSPTLTEDLQFYPVIKAWLTL